MATLFSLKNTLREQTTHSTVCWDWEKKRKKRKRWMQH